MKCASALGSNLMDISKSKTVIDKNAAKPSSLTPASARTAAAEHAGHRLELDRKSVV